MNVHIHLSVSLPRSKSPTSTRRTVASHSPNQIIHSLLKPSLSPSLLVARTHSKLVHINMDSQNIKQRTTTTTTGDDVTAQRPPRKHRKRITKRGLSSLALSIVAPVSLTLLAMYLGSTNTYAKTTPFWFPPVWALHATSAASALLMGLSAWLVWVDGGFHASPVALLLYLSQLGLSLLWDPMVFGSGSNLVGLVLCAGMFGSLVGCYQSFKGVNRLAAQVITPCLVWTAFLALVNLTLVYI